MRKILVTAISGNVANGILKSLKDTDDIVYGCDIYDYPVGIDKVKECWKSDLAISQNYIENLLAKCKKYNITHLIPVNESEIKVINKNKTKFEKENIKLLINNNIIIETCLDKYKTAEFLSQNGITVPDTYKASEFIPDNKEYIIKLNNSCGSRMIKKVKNKKEIEELNIKEDFVVQEYIPDENNEYTVGVFSDRTVTNVIIFKRKLENGYTSFVELVRDDSIKTEAIKIAKAFKLFGSFNIQLRKFNNKNYIFEINPRLSGTVYFRHMLKFKDVLWWLDAVDGKKVNEYDEAFDKAIGLRELNEKFIILE